MFIKKLLLISFLALVGFTFYFKYNKKENFSFKEYVEMINNSNLPWKAQNYENLDILYNKLKKTSGYIKAKNSLDLEIVVHKKESEIPKNFRVSEKWNCKSITDIRDQSDCGSCWAVGAESAMSDRLCIERIKNNKKDNGVYVSSADLIANCSLCGKGCDGGEPTEAYKYLKYNGLVTGGDFGNTNSCYPYPFKKCAHHIKTPLYKNCNTFHYKTPLRTNICKNEKLNWAKSKIFAKKIYTVKGEENIKMELLKNGSMEACFKYKLGFITYKKGVYNCSKDTTKITDGHCMRLVGFGEEKAEDGKLTKYWLLTNNWNESWGENGYVKFDINSDCDLSNELYTASGFYQ